MDTFSNVEKERAQLEEHVAKLQSALQHWQKWNFEYEALKEEIASLPTNTTPQALSRAAHGFDAEVLDEKEIRELLGEDKGISRKPEQVVALLSRRIDYVQRNVETVQKQVDGAVIKLGEVGPSEKQDMTEILEELDEQGNVVSSRLSRPGEATSEVVNALKKAGVKEDDIPETDTTIDDEVALDTTTTSASVSPQGNAQASVPDMRREPASEEGVSKERTEVEWSKGKSVTFAKDTKSESIQSAGKDQKSSTSEKNPVKTTSTRQRIPVIVKNNFQPEDRVLEVDSTNDDDDDTDESTPQVPIIPADESESDAMLRREMLAYSMNEMGAIVAQLDLAETDADDGSYYTDDEDDDDEDEDGVRTSATATDDEEENEFGMNTTGIMSAQYRQEMQDLEARLNAKYFANLGPDAVGMLDEGDGADVEQLATHTARIAVKEDEDMPQRPARGTTTTPAAASKAPSSSALKTTATGSAKKGVRFAEELDVAPPTPAVQVPKTTMKTSTPGIRDVVQERAGLPSAPATAPQPPTSTRPPSRFKAARSAAVQSASPIAAQAPLTPSSTTSASTKPPSSRLTTPANSPLAATVAERPPSSINTASSTEPDEFDPELMRRQVAEEYYRQRNRRISKEGGFRREVQEEAEQERDEMEDERSMAAKGNSIGGEIREEVEEEDGEEMDEPLQKMSLFRKARLKREMAGGR